MLLLMVVNYVCACSNFKQQNCLVDIELRTNITTGQLKSVTCDMNKNASIIIFLLLYYFADAFNKILLYEIRGIKFTPSFCRLQHYESHVKNKIASLLFRRNINTKK